MCVGRGSLVNVGEVDFDERLAQQLQGVQHWHTSEREAGRVDDHGRILLGCLLDPVHQNAFVVGLAKVAVQTERLGQLA